MSVEFKLEGMDAVQRKLKLLPERVGRNAMRRALRKGANIVRDAARANAKRIDDPETRESIWKNIAVQGGGARRERQAGGPMMRVGIRGGARPTSGDNGAPGGNTTHWRFVELGTSQMAAHPFMRTAMSQSAQKVFSVVAQEASRELDKELAKIK